MAITHTWKQYNTNVTEVNGWTWDSDNGVSNNVIVKATSANCKLISSTSLNGEVEVTFSGKTIASMEYSPKMYPQEFTYLEFKEADFLYPRVKFINPSSDWAQGDYVPDPDLIYMAYGTGGTIGGQPNPELVVGIPCYTSSYSYSAGSYIKDVTSSASDTYPVNGRHSDGYWYVYVGSTSDSSKAMGYAIVGGVLKPLTGEGYAIINGVNRAIVRYFSCINNVWESHLTGTEVETLPSGYTQLEWIKFTGSQFIDLGLKATNDMKAEIDFIPNNNSSIVFGTEFNSYGFFLAAWEDPHFSWENRGSYISNAPFIIGERYKLVCDETGLLVNDTKYPLTPKASNRTTYNLHIGCVGAKTNPNNNAQMILFRYKLYIGTTLVRDLIPCVNDLGKVGLWDKLNNTFYANGGTSELVAGEPVTSTVLSPMGFTDITPIMTSNTTPSGYVASASSSESTNRVPWTVFNGTNATEQKSGYWHSQANMPQWIMLQFPEAVKVDMFTIKNCGVLGGINYMGITAFQLQGSNNGSTFTTLGSYTSTGELNATTRYAVNSPNLYKYYRIYITATGFVYSNIDYAVIDQIRFYQSNS